MKVAIPQRDQMALFVFDVDRKKLAAKTFSIKTSDPNWKEKSPRLKKEIMDFLSRHSPEQKDAKQLLNDSLIKAKKHGKKVFVKIGGPRCSPCLKMGAWMDEYRSVLEKDFVILSFHPSRCRNGQEVAEQIVETYGGVPWCCVLDEEGKPLANSDGPLGNVGFPTGGGEGTDHFMNMLRKTGTNISDGEFKALKDSLTNWSDKR